MAAEVVPGEILVAIDKYSARFQEDGKAAVAVARTAFQSLGLHSAEILFDLAAGPNNSARLVTKWSVGADVDLEQLAEQLARMSGVVYAEPNGIAYGAATPNDAAYTATVDSDWGSRWALQGHMVGHDIFGDPTASVGAVEAWEVPGVNYGNGVRVAVLDTGIDLDHPDLVGSLARNPDNSVLGINFVTPGASVDDDNGHGTHVSGLIAATLNNTDRALGTDDPSWNGGVIGVAPGATIMPVKVLNANAGGSNSVIAQGIDWAVANGAQIINMSLGSSGFSQGLYDAVTRAYNAGVLVVVCAHNQNWSTPMHPGSHPMAIGVGATDRYDLATYFTNYGSWVDISAGGYRMLSTYIDTASSATDGYLRGTGTSMSTPIVAGVAALILAQHPTWSLTQVAAQLVGTANDTDQLSGNAGYANQLGSGRVNAFRAVSETLGLPHVVRTSTYLDSSTADQPLTVRFSQGMDPNIDVLANGQPANFEVRFDANGDSVFAANERIDISFYDLDGAGPMPAEYVLGPTVALKLGSSAPGQYQLIVKGGAGGVHDAFGQTLGDANGIAISDHTSTFTIGGPLTFSKTENVSIPDRGTYTSNLAITTVGTVSDLNVRVNLTHTWDENLDVFLIAPDGTRVELFTDVGFAGDNFTNTILDDDATTTITSGTAPFSGSFRPEGNLATLNGKSLAGIWKLEVSDDTRKETGSLLDWSLILNRPEIVITPTSGLVTTESGGSASFTISLSQPPTADVLLRLHSWDNGEGVISATPITVTITPDNWNVPQTIVVVGQDDTLVDGTITYTVMTGVASSADPAFNGINPPNVTLTNLDNDVPPTKFYVVNDGSPDRTYEYAVTGTANENYAINVGNTAPRGAASTAAGDKVWVVDANRNVYVYDPSGALLGSWTAGTLTTTATVEGITTDGLDVWIVDAASDKVYRYSNGASRLSGSQDATSSFNLTGGNSSPKDIVTDGASLWVVNDTNTDKVFKYTVAGTLLGSWTISSPGASSPTGITLDPASPNHLWIVDSGSDRVYQYDAAVSRTSGSQPALSSFALASGNTNPQGIADPPPPMTLQDFGSAHEQALWSVVEELDDSLARRRKRI